MLRYVVKLFYGTKTTLESVLEGTPNLRLQAPFEDRTPSDSRGMGGFTRFIDVDPKSWSEVLCYADRVLLTVR